MHNFIASNSTSITKMRGRLRINEVEVGILQKVRNALNSPQSPQLHSFFTKCHDTKYLFFFCKFVSREVKSLVRCILGKL